MQQLLEKDPPEPFLNHSLKPFCGTIRADIYLSEVINNLQCLVQSRYSLSNCRMNELYSVSQAYPQGWDGFLEPLFSLETFPCPVCGLLEHFSAFFRLIQWAPLLKHQRSMALTIPDTSIEKCWIICYLSPFSVAMTAYLRLGNLQRKENIFGSWFWRLEKGPD